MNDMTAVIVPKSDQISADDLIAGPRTYTIEGVTIRPAAEQPVDVHMRGEKRPWRPCKSMSRVLVDAWGADAKAYTGRSLTLYRDPKVKWGGLEVGGIRISHMSDLTGQRVLVLTVTKGSKKPFVVQPLKDVPPPVDDPDDLPPEPPRYTLEDAKLEGADVTTYAEATAWWKRCKAASSEATGEDAQAWGKLLAEAQQRGEKLKAEAA